MTASEERMRILQMVEEGVISAAEGASLLSAIEQPGAKPAPGQGSRVPPRWFRVRVTDLASGKARVNVNIPLGLVDVGLRMGARFSPDDIGGVDFDQISEAIRGGMEGKIFEAEDAEDGERVEIYVE